MSDIMGAILSRAIGACSTANPMQCTSQSKVCVSKSVYPLVLPLVCHARMKSLPCGTVIRGLSGGRHVTVVNCFLLSSIATGGQRHSTMPRDIPSSSCLLLEGSRAHGVTGRGQLERGSLGSAILIWFLLLDTGGHEIVQRAMVVKA
jgi:hypothetical protein